MNHSGRILGKGLAILAAGVICAAGGVFVTLRYAAGPHVSEKAVLSVLRSEALTFLVTRRTTTQIVVQHDESDFMGDWHGVLWATVSFRWGVDMQKITAADIRRDGQAVICRLPAPQLLDFGVEPGSVGFMSKSTAVPKLMEFFGTTSQRDKLEASLRERAMEFARDRSLLPGRDEIVRQLNDAIAPLKTAGGFDLRFE